MNKVPYDDPKEDSYFGTSFIIYLILAAIAALFLGVMGAYLYNRMLFDLPAVSIPNIFYLSSFVVIIVSYLCSQTIHCFENNRFQRVITYWTLILIAVLLFMVLQMYGWYTLIDSGFPASQNNSVGYLYALSALHLFHILIGIPFHVKILWEQSNALRDDEFARIEYIALQKNKQHLLLMSRYWHFLDALWIVLMLFFVVNKYWM